MILLHLNYATSVQLLTVPTGQIQKLHNIMHCFCMPKFIHKLGTLAAYQSENGACFKCHFLLSKDYGKVLSYISSLIVSLQNYTELSL